MICDSAKIQFVKTSTRIMKYESRVTKLNPEYFNKVKSLHIMLPKTSAYVKSYDGQTKWMYFLIEDDDLLK